MVGMASDHRQGSARTQQRSRVEMHWLGNEGEALLSVSELLWAVVQEV